MNDIYSYISHGGAHYSKNWNKAKQKEYNHWYYLTKSKKNKSPQEEWNDLNNDLKNNKNSDVTPYYSSDGSYMLGRNSKKGFVTISKEKNGSYYRHIVPHDYDGLNDDPHVSYEKQSAKSAKNERDVKKFKKGAKQAKKKVTEFANDVKRGGEYIGKSASKQTSKFISRVKSEINKETTTKKTYKNKKGETVIETTKKKGPFGMLSQTSRTTFMNGKKPSKIIKGTVKTGNRAAINPGHKGYTSKTWSQYGSHTKTHVSSTKKKRR